MSTFPRGNSPKSKLESMLKQLKPALLPLQQLSSEQKTLYTLIIKIFTLYEALLHTKEKLAFVIIMRSIWETSIDLINLSDAFIKNNHQIIQKIQAISDLNHFKISTYEFILSETLFESQSICTKEEQKYIEDFKVRLSKWLKMPDYNQKALKSLIGDKAYSRWENVIKETIKAKIIHQKFILKESSNISKLLESFKNCTWRNNDFNNFAINLLRIFPSEKIHDKLTSEALISFHKKIYMEGNAAIHTSSNFTPIIFEQKISNDSIEFNDAIFILNLVIYSAKQGGLLNGSNNT